MHVKERRAGLEPARRVRGAAAAASRPLLEHLRTRVEGVPGKPLHVERAYGREPAAGELAAQLRSAGFATLHEEDRSPDLVRYAAEVRERLPFLRAAAFLTGWRGDIDLDELQAVAEAAGAAIDRGVFGYVLVVASLPNLVVSA